MKIIELDKIIKKSEIAMIKVVKNKSRAKNLDIQQDTFADENVNDTWRANKNGHHSNNQKKPKVRAWLIGIVAPIPNQIATNVPTINVSEAIGLLKGF